MIFEHFSDIPVTLDKRIYGQTNDMKPRGLWFSPEGVETSWQEWCQAQDFRLGHLKYRHTFELDMSKILLVDTHDGIDSFYDQYKFFGPVEQALSDQRFARMTRWSVDWGKLTQEYSGILITPYQWEQRLGNNLWYYGWDCASGCLWDTSVIRNWKLDVPLLENHINTCEE